MNRREFLALGSAATAAMVLDPERLLWVPGARTFFLPSQQIVTADTLTEAVRLGFHAHVPDGHGGWAQMEIHLSGAVSAERLVERFKREVADIERLGGYVVGNTQYVQHTIPKGVLDGEKTRTLLAT